MTPRPTSPSPVARDADISRPTLRELARGAEEAAAALERGQAGQPLVSLARRLSGTAEPLALALLASDEAARDAVLRWLVGPHHALLRVAALQVPGLVQLQLRQRGFAIGDSNAAQDFGSPEDFGDALRALLPGAAGPLVLTLPAARPAPDLDITVLPPPAQLDSTPGLGARLAATPSVLLLALTAPSAAPGDTERMAVALLAPFASAAWPVVVGAADDTAAQRLARGWTAGLPQPLPVTLLDSADPAAPLPDFLMQGPQRPLAAAVLQAAQVRRAAALVEMLQERHDSDLAQVRSRLKREQRLEKSTEGSGTDAATRAELDQVKQRANEDFASLAQSIRESQRRALLRGGGVGQLLVELSSSVQPADLVQQPQGKLLRLSLDRNFIDLTRQRFAKGLRRQLDEHCVVVRDSFELLRRRTEAALQAAGARTLSVPLEMPDNGSLWHTLRDAVQLGLKYSGELPRRGFMQRLGAGRQLVFGVLMVLSLVGSIMGFNVRQAALAGVFLLLLFGAGVAWTFHAWKRDDAQALDREIDKVREGVLAELERGAAEVSRELQARLLEFVEQAKRDFTARLDAALREWQTTAAAQGDGERKEARARVKLIEQREKEMQALGLQLAKLRTQSLQLQSEAQAALREAAQGSVAAGAA